MKLPECRRYCRHTKMKTQNWHSANQLHVLHFILHPQNEVWPFEILCSVLKCLLLLFQWSFLQWSGRLWTWSTRFTLQLKSAFSRSCGEEGARPLRWPRLWSRSIWSSINALASGIKEGGCKFLWAASRTGSAGPGNHFENAGQDISQWELTQSQLFFFVFEFSLKAEISKSPSQTLDSLMIFDGFHVSTPAGSAHRYGPKDRTTPDRSDRAERSARMRKALEKTAAAGAWSGPRLEKFVRQTPGTMELRQVGVFRFRIGRWRFVKFRYLDRDSQDKSCWHKAVKQAQPPLMQWTRPHHAADGSTSWTLRLCMDDLNPPLNDEGMQVFCRWLHQTFQLMREQHSIRSMQMVPCLKVNIIKAQTHAFCYLISRWCGRKASRSLEALTFQLFYLSEKAQTTWWKWLGDDVKTLFNHVIFQILRDLWPEVSAELSMAWNHMGDDALGRLLQALQRSQVRVRSLKFGGNNLSPEGGQAESWKLGSLEMGQTVDSCRCDSDVLFVLRLGMDLFLRGSCALVDRRPLATLRFHPRSPLHLAPLGCGKVRNMWKRYDDQKSCCLLS